MTRLPFWYRVECDFCFRDQHTNLYFVDLPDDIQTYTACMKCIEEKEWKK